MVCDGYVEFEGAGFHRSAIMEEFPDNEEKNGRLAAILDFISAKFVMGYPCVRPYILFYIHGPAILHFFLVTYISQNYSNSKLPLNGHF